VTTDEEQILDSLANELIAYGKNILIIQNIFEHISKDIGQPIGIASPYLNFRDALFHYHKMYEACNEQDGHERVIQQKACIKEHLNRGIKDFIVYLCSNCLTRVMNKMLFGSFHAVTDEIFQELRRIYHQLKNAVVDIRLKGTALIHFEDEDGMQWLNDTIEVIQIFYNDFFKKYPDVHELYVNTIRQMFT